MSVAETQARVCFYFHIKLARSLKIHRNTQAVNLEKTKNNDKYANLSYVNVFHNKIGVNQLILFF